jgi:hypothetical protein
MQDSNSPFFGLQNKCISFLYRLQRINRQAPDFIFIDLDRSSFKTERAHKLALNVTLKNISEKVDGKPTVMWSGDGYHLPTSLGFGVRTNRGYLSSLINLLNHVKHLLNGTFPMVNLTGRIMLQSHSKIACCEYQVPIILNVLNKKAKVHKLG